MNTVFMLMKCLVVATYNLILVPLGGVGFFFCFFSFCGLFGGQEKKKKAKEFREIKWGQAPHALKKQQTV